MKLDRKRNHSYSGLKRGARNHAARVTSAATAAMGRFNHSNDGVQRTNGNVAMAFHRGLRYRPEGMYGFPVTTKVVNTKSPKAG